MMFLNTQYSLRNEHNIMMTTARSIAVPAITHIYYTLLFSYTFHPAHHAHTHTHIYIYIIILYLYGSIWNFPAYDVSGLTPMLYSLLSELAINANQLDR